MTKFTIYDTATHAVLYSGTASDPESLVTDATSLVLGEVYGPGFIDDSEFVPMPESPGADYKFNYVTRQWESIMTAEKQWSLIRAERSRRLLASDWTQLPDVPISTKEAWAVYRQALRDITLQPDPENLIWPTPPNGS